MMTDATVLADALVEAGICKCLHSKFPPSGYVYTIPYSAEAEGSAGELINDWRVAGKVLELWPEFCIRDQHEGWEIQGPYGVISKPNKSLPRAIIEAWYAAHD
jgi:hypothetical protein